MEVAFLGTGRVGRALAGRLAATGEHRLLGAFRDPASASAREAVAGLPGLLPLGVAEAVARAEVVFLATPFAAAPDAVGGVGDWGDRVLVDCTNPVGPGMVHALGDRAGAVDIARAARGARVVKGFNVYGVENLADPRYPGYGELRPALPLAGDDAAAKELVATLARQMGWEPVDTGPLAAALDLEHLALVWIRMVRAQGVDPGFTWARLRR